MASFSDEMRRSSRALPSPAHLAGVAVLVLTLLYFITGSGKTVKGALQRECEPVFVDWSKFNAPPETMGGKAAIFTIKFDDAVLPWLIRGLQSLKYTVALLTKPEEEESARAFLLNHLATQIFDTATVQAQAVSMHHQMLNASISKVFVNVWSRDMPLAAGRGLVNLLVMPHVLKGSTPFVSSVHAAAFATYDFMISRDGQESNYHIKAMMPAMERLQLQQQNRMFPLADVFPFPSGLVSEQARKQFDAKMFQVVHRSFLNKVIRFFMQSTLGAYKARSLPANQKVKDIQAQAKLGHARYAAVIVEARPHFALLYTVLNAAWFLPGWQLHLVHTRANDGHVHRLLSPYVDVKYHLLDTDNVDIDHYNMLMKNESFWNMFGADHIQLFQTDSLILKHGLEKFTKFDYIGAPWHLENERWSQPELKAALPAGVGNGGFSMRSVKAMTNIAKQHGAQSALKEQEDIFYAKHIQASEQFVLADRRSAYSYCLEVPCHDLGMERQPHALHASWYYNDVPTMQRLLDSSLYDLGDCIH